VQEAPGGSLPDVLTAHLEAREALRRGLHAGGWETAGGGPLIIGVAGSVAAGKSTCAEELCARLPGRVGVISTDGFLYPNAELAARGLLARKGFPESYNRQLVDGVLSRIASGAPEVEVPTYSHHTYDIEGPPTVVRRPDVLIVEGVVALQAPIADYCSTRVYIDADEADLRRWYVERFVVWAGEGVGFYAQWAGMPADEVRQLATMVWEHVNLPNLTEHILPTRWTADVVVRMGADHNEAAVAVRVR
jgi:type I pantothenate kinase